MVSCIILCVVSVIAVCIVFGSFIRVSLDANDIEREAKRQLEEECISWNSLNYRSLLDERIEKLEKELHSNK